MKQYLVFLHMLSCMFSLFGKAQSCFWHTSSWRNAETDGPFDEESISEEALNHFQNEFVHLKLLKALDLKSIPEFDSTSDLDPIRKSILSLPPTELPEARKENGPTKRTTIITFGEIGVMHNTDNRTTNGPFISFKLPAVKSNTTSTLWYALEGSGPVSIAMCLCDSKPTINCNINCVPIEESTSKNASISVWRRLRLGGITSQNKSTLGIFFSGPKVTLSQSKRSFLVSEFEEDQHENRLKRSSNQDCTVSVHIQMNDTGPSSAVPSAMECCRYGFWVDVATIGWNETIISPSGFTFNSCLGHCNGAFDRRSNESSIDHSLLVNLYKQTLGIGLTPCCVPSKTTSLPVTIVKPDKSVERTVIPDFIIEECACFGFQ